MRKFLLIVALTFVGLGSVVAGATVSQPTGSAANQASNWEPYAESLFGHDAECYKHEANSNGDSNSDHGRSDEDQVKLNTFNQSWPGDHWELLVIKAGTGNAVYPHPEAGVWYDSPQNKDVSHWIVCKGTTPEPPVVTEPPTTEPPVTEPPTTEPPVTEPPVVEPPVVEPPVFDVTPPPAPQVTPEVVVEAPVVVAEPVVELAYTGSQTNLLVAIAAGLLVGGLVFVAASRRRGA